jgi:hypothetical protein
MTRFEFWRSCSRELVEIRFLKIMRTTEGWPAGWNFPDPEENK